MRCRPLNSKELAISNFETIKILDGKLVVLFDPANEFDPNDVFICYNHLKFSFYSL